MALHLRAKEQNTVGPNYNTLPFPAINPGYLPGAEKETDETEWTSSISATDVYLKRRRRWIVNI